MNTLNVSHPTAESGEFEMDVALAGSAFESFAERLTSGEDAAATELLDHFSGRLVSLARLKLSPRLATKSDPEDVVQSVMRTFFRRLGTNEVELRDWPSLWGLLSLLTIRKCAMRGRAFGTARRNVNLEVSLTGAECPELSIPGREPTPFEVATFMDFLEQLRRTASPLQCTVIDGLVSGQSVAELARQLGRSERTIYRATEKLRKILLRMTANYHSN